MDNLIGKAAPDFRAPAVLEDGMIDENFSLSGYLDGAYGVLMFYPLDFTFVCPSEIIALDRRADAFASRDARLAAVSIDSQFTHHAWRSTPISEGGIGQVRFPLVADITKSIARSYGVLHEDAVALRATFLIDGDLVIRHATINDLPLGRNVEETLRMVDALRFHEEHGEVCPAGWQDGDPGMQPTTEGVASYLSAHAESL
ncbi:MAG: alkyl hydroperoxide reductase [Alphaproteobacteria bacterium]|nr:alkyl hydroperoxide reductase [Alphaproteobacteria bacterium]|tara:strand:- start:290 stop:892 length:603 start_codon:yes stop_codon:yes gene_type:complete